MVTIRSYWRVVNLNLEIGKRKKKRGKRTKETTEEHDLVKSPSGQIVDWLIDRYLTSPFDDSTI